MNCNSNMNSGSCSMKMGKSCPNTCNMSGCNCCPRPNPIVMPGRVCINNQYTAQEQPVVIPVERRTINHCVYVPRFYPMYMNTYYTNVPNQY